MAQAGPVRLAFEVLGSNSKRRSPLLLLHGILGSRSNLKTVGKRLSDELDTEVYLLDARNHGCSPHVPHMDYSSMCQDLVLFCKEKELTDTTVIGHSMGGKTAMQLALNFPEYVKQLVVLDVAPVAKSGLSDLSYVLPALLNVDITTMRSKKQVDMALMDVVPSSLMRNFLLKSLVQDSGALRWKFNLEAVANNYSTLIGFRNSGKPFHGPAGFIGGANSRYITQSDEASILQLFPRASISHIPGAGHWVHSDRPTEVVTAIKKLYSNTE